jgi:hypothetical protein
VDRSVFQPLTPSLVGELERLWSTNNRDLLAIRARPRPPNDDSEEAASYQPTEALQLPGDTGHVPPRRTAVAFTIDYSRFTNAEIVEAFRTWLRANRPKRWRRPRNHFPAVRRGVKINDYVVALERLAIMRLLHWNTPQMLKQEFPEAWKLYGRKEGVFRREIRGALSFYRERFPFISKQEYPDSYERLHASRHARKSKRRTINLP